ncbi:MAG TPA: hypothetical protein VF459_02615 [Caulobacteraceae bacterium]
MINNTLTQRSGETEAIVLIKAAPQVGQRHGETVCCAAMDLHGNWLRLYPVAFRTLEDGQKFGRWDRIRFGWRLPDDDKRVESRRVDQETLAVVGSLKHSERQRFLAKRVVRSLNRERAEGRSLALLRPEILGFAIERKSADELEQERSKFAALHAQTDLFNTKPMIPYQPCPYRFRYRYRTDDGDREGTCQDWEMEATYFRWSKSQGEAATLDQIQKIFGEEYPRKGMLLAMGTHSQYPDTWLINGVVRLDEIEQLSLI